MAGPIRLDARRAQLLVVDVQEKLLPHIHGHAALAPQCIRMVRAAEVLELPVTASEQYVAGLGPTVGPLREALAAAPRFEKNAFSAFADPELRAHLNDHMRSAVLLVGIETHVCILQTALDLLEEQMQPVVLADAVGSRRAYDHDIAIERMRRQGVLVTTVESAIFELTGEAGTPQFKQILPLVRDL